MEEVRGVCDPATLLFSWEGSRLRALGNRQNTRKVHCSLQGLKAHATHGRDWFDYSFFSPFETRRTCFIFLLFWLLNWTYTWISGLRGLPFHAQSLHARGGYFTPCMTIRWPTGNSVFYCTTAFFLSPRSIFSYKIFSHIYPFFRLVVYLWERSERLRPGQGPWIPMSS